MLEDFAFEPPYIAISPAPESRSAHAPRPLRWEHRARRWTPRAALTEVYSLKRSVSQLAFRPMAVTRARCMWMDSLVVPPEYLRRSAAQGLRRTATEAASHLLHR